MNQININLPAIQEIAVKGVRRTAVFMGLGINAANNSDFKQYELTNITNLQFIEPTLDEQTLTGFKTEFARWVISCGLRELIETFCVLLDEAHLACLWISASCGQVSTDQIQTEDQRFRRCGLRGKLTHLSDNFGVGVKHPDYLFSINQARHCLTHRRAIVGNEDCFDSSELVVKWRGVDLYAETPSGERVSLHPMPEDGVVLPEGGKIMVAFPERMRTFRLYSIVTFSPIELAEICHFALNTTREVIHSVEAYARDRNIPLVNPDGIAQ